MRLKRLSAFLLSLVFLVLTLITPLVRADDSLQNLQSYCPKFSLQLVNDNLNCLQWNFGENFKDGYGINLSEGWAETNLRGEDVKIGVIDGGFHYHENSDFNKESFLPGRNFKTQSDVPNTTLEKSYKVSATDEINHGTHILGTIIQATNNGKGTAGIAPLSQVIPITINKNAELGEIAEAIRQADAKGADIINLSLDSDAEDNDIVQKAAEEAYQHNILLVAAAGNHVIPDDKKSIENLVKPRYPIIRNDWDQNHYYNSSSQSPPKKSLRALIVEAYSYGGYIARYSRSDLAYKGYNYEQFANIAAPGGEFGEGKDRKACHSISDNNIHDIKNYRAGIAQVDYQPAVGFVVLFCQGTSQATAHVSGVAALIISMLKKEALFNGRVDPDLVISILENSAHIGERNRDDTANSKPKNRGIIRYSREFEGPYYRIDHMPGKSHPVDAGLAVKLTKAYISQQKMQRDFSPEEAEKSVSEVAEQKYQEITVKKPGLTSQFPTHPNTELIEPLQPSPTPSPIELGKDESVNPPPSKTQTMWEKSLNLLDLSLGIVLAGQLVFSNFEGLLFFLGLLISGSQSLGLLNQHQSSFQISALILLMLYGIAIVAAKNPLLKNLKPRWFLTGISFGAILSLIYSTTFTILPLSSVTHWYPHTIIPTAILVSILAWRILQEPTSNFYTGALTGKSEKFTWGLSIGSSIVLIGCAISQRMNLPVASIMIVAAIAIFLMSWAATPKLYRWFSNYAAHGATVIVVSSIIILKTHWSILTIEPRLPQALLAFLAIIYLALGISKRKKK
jgi:hypothetical protein